MRSDLRRRAAASLVVLFASATWSGGTVVAGEERHRPLNAALSTVLRDAGFTGRVGSSLESRLGRPIDEKLADLGRLLFFDTMTGLHDDNACAGCHAPATGFGDTQSIAIGIQSNRVVGPGRAGPRNQQRTPTIVNTAFYPSLMWNGRFSAPSGDPFDNAFGYAFPAPEGATRFPANDPVVTHLLIAQAHLPSTELVEVAGFTGTRGMIGPRFDAFDDGAGANVPDPDASGYRNEPIRQQVLARLNANGNYRRLSESCFRGLRRAIRSTSRCSDPRSPSSSSRSSARMRRSTDSGAATTMR